MKAFDGWALDATTGPMMFIVGSGRSGTSLLASMLDAHPDLAVTRESHFLPRLILKLPATLVSEGEIDQLTTFLRHDKWFADWDYDLELLHGALIARLPLSRCDALRMIYRVFAAAAGKTRFGEKTPAYVYAIPVIAREFPAARFIHIVRDGRNVALSFRESDFGDDNLEQAALNWQLRVLDGHNAGVRLGAARYIEVRYEDLIAEPETELRRLCRFLDLGFDPQMLVYHQRTNTRWETTGAGTNLRRPPTTTRRWQDQMSRSEQARFALLAGRALRRWGYPIDTQASIVDRGAAYVARAGWWYHRLRSKTGVARRRRTVHGRKGDHAARSDR